MRSLLISALGLGLGSLLAACSGGTTAGGTPTGVVNPDPLPAPVRGSLVSQAASVSVNVGGTSLTTLSPSTLAGFLESAQQGTVAVAGQPQCSVSIYRVHYNTIGGAGEATDGSAAIFVPTGGGASCSNSRPAGDACTSPASCLVYIATRIRPQHMAACRMSSAMRATRRT